MKKTKFALQITVFLIIAFSYFSCNPIENTTQSNSLLIAVRILGHDIEDQPADYLQSDVVRVDPQTGQGFVMADTAVASLRAELLDPNPDAESSIYNGIYVTRYVVTYIRSDGKNTPGADVPHSFEGATQSWIQVGQEEEVGFIVVREVAKMEPPLLELHDKREEGVLQVTAQIDFYGHDTVNNQVKATGYLAIFFANYMDAEAPPEPEPEPEEEP
jgi:hypothetical protein